MLWPWILSHMYKHGVNISKVKNNVDGDLSPGVVGCGVAWCSGALCGMLGRVKLFIQDRRWIRTRLAV